MEAQNGTKKIKQSRIAHHAGKYGARPKVGDQAEGEKCTTGTSSQSPQGSQHDNTSQNGLLDNINENHKNTDNRKKWSREEQKDVLKAYYKAIEHPQKSNTQQTYDIWRQMNPDSRTYIDANKLGNFRRDILKNNRITALEIEKIKDEVRKEFGNTLIGNTLDDTIQESINERSEHHTETMEESKVNDERTTNDNDNQDMELEANVRNGPVERKEVLMMTLKIKEKFEEVKGVDIKERNSLPKIIYNNKTRNLIETAEKSLNMIKEENNGELGLTTINILIYTTAVIITEEAGVKIKKRSRDYKQRQPAWKEKIRNEIKRMRADLSVLSELLHGNDNVRVHKVQKFKRKYNIKTKDDLQIATEKLKQKIQAKAQRLRRYEKRSKQFRQNRLFMNDTKKFYRELGKMPFEVKERPSKEDIEKFWSKIWEEEKHHNYDAEWIKDQRCLNDDLEEQVWKEITKDEITAAIKRSSNWKSPGIDKVPNFWLKRFESLYGDISRNFNKIVRTPEEVPSWLTQGITYLIPKTEDTRNPKNYRPITCLPTLYKILTSIITERTYTYLVEHDLLPVEQKGCRKGSYGCKDQLLINKMILEDCRNRRKNLCTAWIDYRKAYDSVPHSWIIETLKMNKVSQTLINFLSHSMTTWQTTLILNSISGTTTSRPVDIRNGIFQGDSLSPLLFCLALVPLSQLLNATNIGYEIYQERSNHLLYMDDLKLYCKNENELEGLLNTVKLYSDDIKMEFGLDKCAKAMFRRGKLTESSPITVDENTIIKQLDNEEFYKYLGINEGDGIQHATMKEKIRKEYYRRVKLVLKSELNAANKIEAVNSLAIPVVTYSFNIINWKREEIKRIDRKTRKLLTIHRMHHPKADVHRIYLKRNEGGKGLIQLENAYKTATIGLNTYLKTTDDKLMKQVYHHECHKKLYSVNKEATRFERELKIDDQEFEPNLQASEKAKKRKTIARKELAEQLKKNWQEKPLHGRYVTRLNKDDVDFEQSLKWMKSARLKGETEGFLMAAQDQSLPTKLYNHKIIKTGDDPKCRLCNEYDESIDHIISGCSVLAKEEYLHRHDKVLTYIHWIICKHYNINVCTEWYNHKPPTVLENKQATIIWDMPITADKTI